MKRRQILVGINLGLAVLLITLSGCMKAPEHVQDFGPEVSSQEVDTAIRSVQTVSPQTIKQGEFAYLERTTQVESLPPTVILQRGDTVTKKEDDPEDPGTYYLLTIVSELVELIDGQMKHSTKESTARLDKQLPLQASQVLKVQATAGQRVTYHNLKSEAGTIPVPPLVLKRTDCGGLVPSVCGTHLIATRLSFDKVEWENDVGSKTSFLFIFSPDTPYFASQILGCAETMLPYQGQKVHVTQCEETKDFTAGH